MISALKAQQDTALDAILCRSESLRPILGREGSERGGLSSIEALEAARAARLIEDQQRLAQLFGGFFLP